MAGMDQEAWFAGFDVVPRAVLLLVSQAPDARHHGRHGPQDSVESSQVAVLGQGCLHARCCATCVLVQTVFYTVWRFRSCSSSRSSMMLSRCVPFHCRQARVARRHVLLGPFLEVQFLDKLFSPVVVQRQVPFYVRAVRSVTRGDTIGAVLGRGLGHCNRCRGLDSAAGYLQDRRLSYCGAKAVPRCPGDSPVGFSMVVVVPVVLVQQVVPCPW